MTKHDDPIEPEALLYGLAGAAAAEPLAPGEAVHTRVMHSVRRGGRYGIYVDRVARLFGLPVERAQRLLGRIEDASVFAPFLVPGVAMLPVKPGPGLEGAVAAIGLLAPGTVFPRHDHVGDEVTLVLDGGFRDEGGREIWRGDELFKPAGSEHDFVVIGDRACVAAVLALGGVAFR
jgi:hypothetical protein